MKDKIFFSFEGGEGSGKTTQIQMVKDWAQKKDFKVITSREPGGSKRAELIRRVALAVKVEDRSPENLEIIDFNIAELAKKIKDSNIGERELCERVGKLSSQSEMTSDMELTLFIMSRIAHVEELIWPFLRGDRDEDLLILDRFWHSSYAYQMFTRCRSAETPELFWFLNALFDWHLRFLYDKMIYPEVIYLDVDPKIGLERVGLRGDDKTVFDMENLPFHISVRNGFLDLYMNSFPGCNIPRYNSRINIIDANQDSDTVFEGVKELFQDRILSTGKLFDSDS